MLEFIHWNSNSISKREKTKISLLEVLIIHVVIMVAFSENMLNCAIRNDEVIREVFCNDTLRSDHLSDTNVGFASIYFHHG